EPDAWERLANWRQELDDLDGSIAAYERALTLAPDSPSVRFNLAEALRDAQRFDDAVARYRELIHKYGETHDDESEGLLAEAYAGLAATLNLAERYAEAAETADEFLQRFPDHAEALYEKASALDGLGRRDEAIAAYEQAIEADPLNPGIRNDLADTYLANGATADAIDLAESAVALDPEFVIGYETLAQALLAAGRGEEAEHAAERAAELHAAFDAEDDEPEQ
ncbi:MAG TPA: tetratricopeptide repeat protein, partial [Ktedonobacterales bacterium]